MRRSTVGFLIAACAWIACQGEPGPSLLVDLHTDLRPGTEFDAVRVSVGDRVELRPVSRADDYSNPSRLADLEGLSAGDVNLTTELLLGGAPVVQSDMVVRLMGTVGVVVVITRSCLGVSCPDVTVPTTCLGGGCVPRACSTQDRSACGTPACTSETDCPSAESCSPPVCGLGVCLYPPNDSLSASGQTCTVSGCRDGGRTDAAMDSAMADAGADGSPADAAPTDGPRSVEVCNEFDDDGDGRVDEDPDGRLPTVCYGFGAVGTASAWQNLDENNLRCSRWTLAGSLEVTALWSYLRPETGASQRFRAAIYRVDEPCVSEACGTLLAITDEISPDTAALAQWVRFSFTDPPILESGDYYLGVHSSAPNAAWRYNNLGGGPGWFFNSDFDIPLPGVMSTASTTTGSLTVFAERAPPL